MTSPRAVDPLRARLAAVDSWADVLALKAALTAVLDLHVPCGEEGCDDQFHDSCPECLMGDGPMLPCATRCVIAAAFGVLPVEDNQ